MQNKIQSQEKKILEYLKQGWSITPLQALRKFDCLRLGGRIFDLRTKGYVIEMKMIKTNTGKRVASYKMGGLKFDQKKIESNYRNVRRIKGDSPVGIAISNF
jgi:hypothetical protein